MGAAAARKRASVSPAGAAGGRSFAADAPAVNGFSRASQYWQTSRKSGLSLPHAWQRRVPGSEASGAGASAEAAAPPRRGASQYWQISKNSGLRLPQAGQRLTAIILTLRKADPARAGSANRWRRCPARRPGVSRARRRPPGLARSTTRLRAGPHPGRPPGAAPCPGAR